MTGTKQTQSSDKSLVIQKRLEGKSMNQIVRETGISKGKVQYLINDWKQKMGASSVEKITEFASLVKRSDISIEQCAQGFRMINILKNLGIGNMDVANNDGKNNSKEENGHTNDNYNKLFSFIEEIYKNCIRGSTCHNSLMD